jgi:hypothetical protein
MNLFKNLPKEKNYKIHYLLILEFSREIYLSEIKFKYVSFLLANRTHEITALIDKIMTEFKGNAQIEGGYHNGKLNKKFIEFFMEKVKDQ